ncbi:MAG: histidine kinase [Rhodospirillales bacterium]|nr:histidine kinase [Rhodospirillales bacterium]
MGRDAIGSACFAFIAVAAATALRLAFDESVHGVGYLFYFPAVAIATWWGDWRTGLTATLLSLMATFFLLMPPDSSTELSLPLFALGAGAIILPLERSRALATKLAEEKAQVAELLQREQTLTQELDWLMREMRHRVGNNLQTISGLLLLQKRQVHDSATRALLSESLRRVEAFIDVNNQMLHPAGEIQFGAYLARMCTQLVSATRPIGVACDIDYDHFDFPPQIAAPVALIANELVVNALEHGFGRDRTGTLRVRLKRDEDGQVRLVVADDGAGIAGAATLDGRDNLGLEIVRSLVRQLGGELTTRIGDGTEVTVRFEDDGVPGAPPTGSADRAAPGAGAKLRTAN